MAELNKRTFNLTKFHEISYNGIPVTVLKNCIQQYARINNFKKGLWCLVELDLFSIAEESDQINKRNATSIRSEMMNKLIHMVTCDIGIAVWNLPLTAQMLYEKWMRTKNTLESRPHLVALYSTICNSPKSKMLEDIKLVYRLPPYINDSDIHKQFVQTYQDNLYAEFILLKFFFFFH